MRGEAVTRIEVDTPDQTPPLRDGLRRAGLPVFEADVRFAMRYLIDRGIRGGLEIDTAGAGQAGESTAGDGRRAGAGRTPDGMGADHPPFHVDVLFDDPEVRPAELRLLHRARRL